MDLATICREEGRDRRPNPYVLMATGTRNSAVPAIKAGVVSEEDFAELSAGDWLEMAWVHVHAGVRDVITEAYWAKVGPMGHTQTPQKPHVGYLALPPQKPRVGYLL